jgi:hypothetical protein
MDVSDFTESFTDSGESFFFDIQILDAFCSIINGVVGLLAFLFFMVTQFNSFLYVINVTAVVFLFTE